MKLDFTLHHYQSTDIDGNELGGYVAGTKQDRYPYKIFVSKKKFWENLTAYFS
jgi:hypothetical protein